MDINELNTISLKIYEIFFKGLKKFELDGIEYKIQKFSSGLRYMDLEGYRFIEQNPRKPSEWGKKAREGHKILWVIQGSKYIAQVFDGEFKKL
jgi:hypothetical protein